MKSKLALTDARRLYDEAEAMTVAELRRINKLYFGSEWLSSAKKKTIVRGFRKDLEKVITEAGGKLP